MAALNHNAVFICSCGSHDVITEVQWLVNSISLEDIPHESNMQVNVHFDREFQIGLLELNQLDGNFNNTRIHCMATFDTGLVGTSFSTTLLLQGLPTSYIVCACS